MMRDVLSITILGVLSLSFPIIFISLTNVFPLFALTKWDMLHVASSLGVVNLFITIPAITALMIIFAYQRFLSDSVIITIQASGGSSLMSAMPGLFVAMTMALVMFGLSTILVPSSNRNIHDMLQFLRRNMDFTMLDAGRYYNFKYEGVTIYFEGKDRSGRILGLFINERLPPDDKGVVIEKTYHAREGYVIDSPDDKGLLMIDGSALVPLATGNGSDIVKFDNLFWRPKDDMSKVLRKNEYHDEMETPQLFDKLPTELVSNEKRWPALGELVKRLSYPLITLTHTLLGLGIMLTFSSPTGRGRGTIITLVIAASLVLVFHIAYVFLAETVTYAGLTSVQKFLGLFLFEFSVGILLVMRGTDPRMKSRGGKFSELFYKMFRQEPDAIHQLRNLMPSALKTGSKNLIRFGRMTPDKNIGLAWKVSGRGGIVSIKDLNPLGQPNSIFATDLEAGSVLRQQIDIINALAGSYALRVTACGRVGASKISIIIRYGVHQEILHKIDFKLNAKWQRCRTEFILPTIDAATPLLLEVIAGNEPVRVTDARLIPIDNSRKKFSVSFKTRGNVNLPSTRLRALMLEDYLNLIGWETSINSRGRYDLLLCQKTTPWLSLIAARMTGKSVLYDIDDDELSESSLRRLRVSLFSRNASEMTVGSSHLAEKFSRYQNRITLFENPVDVMDTDIIRDGSPWRGRIVWFGMPENLWMLEDIHLQYPVTTITKGGSVTFDLLTIDRHLIDHDLALIPVVLNDHTRAKNSHRLIKCVALGLPFLASDTFEHRRVLNVIGLSHRFLVQDHEDWNKRIALLAQDYENYLLDVMTAREAAFSIYGIETIAEKWIEDRLAFYKRKS